MAEKKTNELEDGPERKDQRKILKYLKTNLPAEMWPVFFDLDRMSLEGAEWFVNYVKRTGGKNAVS
jgi:hypothetical protein